MAEGSSGDEIAVGGISARAPVNRILRSSIVDGPGNRAVVFLQGCNLNCIYCHNPETITRCCSCGDCLAVCPAGALSAADPVPDRPEAEGAGAYPCGIRWNKEACILCDACLKACSYNSSPRVRYVSPGEVMAEIEPALPFIRGITVSGGECTLYPGFLRGLGKLARDRSLTFFLDSNGTYDFSSDPDLMDLTGSVMLDVKADDENPGEYRRVTGSDGGYILDRAEYLAETGKLWELRTVVSPGLFDAAAVVDKACRRISFTLGGRNRDGGTIPQYKLIRYRPVGVRPEAAAVLSTPDEALMEKLAGICKAYGLRAVIV